jgi:hypothetical protein
LQKPTCNTEIKTNNTTLAVTQTLMHNTHTIENKKNLVLNNSSLVVAQKQLVKLLMIQKTDSLATTQESKPKHRKPNICITKKTAKQNYVLESQIIKSDLRSHKMGLYPMTNTPNLVHT